ncbi:methyltransferase [Actinoplanes subglobosus]|uniref:Methyltransferase n=1 Tax=Actinoplanes subglobosus TaxID=1547892 RepID=A0ABV8JBD6_9ACTN
MTTTGDELHRLGRALRERGYTFTTVTPATQARVNRRPENAEARDLRGVFGWSRPFRPQTVPGEILDMLRAADGVERCGSLWRSRVRFSSYGGELFVHSAFPTDAADTVFFGPDTYRMADAAVAYTDSRRAPLNRVVDVGCGTGAGAIAVAKRAPRAEVVAVDINPVALRFTEVNAHLAGTVNVSAQHSDLLTALDGDFDLILSNPPFMIDPAGRTYRDGGGPDGHDLSLGLIDTAAKRLAPGGTLVLFTGTGIVDGRDPLRETAADHLEGTDLSWTYREVDPDVYGEELDGPAYGHAERIAVVLLTATRPR